MVHPVPLALGLRLREDTVAALSEKLVQYTYFIRPNGHRTRDILVMYLC